MLSQIRPAIVSLALFTVITGLADPALVTGIAQVFFRHQANGSLIVKDGKVVGSSLIGQPFDDPKYFWGRPSATSPFPYNVGASSGSNQGPTNPALLEAVGGRVAILRAAALSQVRRVAMARGIEETKVRQLVEQHIEGRQLGLLGEPRVNVLILNLALDGTGL